jgi:carbonic anhydrase/acetyltransferase-like protein (isoleucine patch superfamily)
MIFKSFKTSWFTGEHNANISDSAFVFSTASVTGMIEIDQNVLVCPGASLRGDEGGKIYIGVNSNVQDNVIMHGLKHKGVLVADQFYSVYISKGVSCAHGSIVHGPAFIGENTFLGFSSITHSSEIGRDCFIGHGAKVIGVTIPDGKFVPHGRIVISEEDVDKLLDVPEELKHFNGEVVQVNVELAKSYLTAYGPNHDCVTV